MKPLSLEEINSWDDNGFSDTAEEAARLLHTAREYYRLREALEKIAQPEQSEHSIAEEAYYVTMIAREALKESAE